MLTKSFLLLPPHTSVLPLIVCLCVYVEKETERNNLQEASGPCVKDSVCWDSALHSSPWGSPASGPMSATLLSTFQARVPENPLSKSDLRCESPSHSVSTL